MTTSSQSPDTPNQPSDRLLAALVDLGTVQAAMLADRIKDHIEDPPQDQSGDGGCVVWTGGVTGAGQPVIRIDGAQTALPRHLWQLLHPDQPAPTQVYRTCRHPRCLAPTHLSDQPPTASRTHLEAFLAIPAASPSASQACHRWSGACNTHGQPIAYLDGVVTVCHRWIWEQLHGPIPTGHLIDHTCHNPACLNPNHLELRTPAQHAHNLAAAHRYPHGETHWNHKISATDAATIRTSTAPISDLLTRYPIGRTAIRNIQHGRAWRTT